MTTPTVVVLGGGPAGAIAGLVLARAGLEAVVVEANSGPQPKVGETLPPSARPVLERLDLGGLLQAPAHRRCFGHRSVWGRPDAVEEDFLFGPLGAGWHLDRETFERDLAEAAANGGVHWRWDHHAVDARWRDDRWWLQIEGPAALVELAADFVIDATGRHARFARGTGVRRRQLDRLVGVAATLGPHGDAARLDGFTLVEARPQGWWYTAPLTGDRVVAVHLTDGDRLDTAMARTADGWRRLLADAPHTTVRLGDAARRLTEAPRIVAAGCGRLDALHGPGWLAVGDAAVSYDPLTSHGIGSALATGYYGACAVADHLRGRADALPTYAALVTAMFEDTWVQLHERYAMEQRWPDEPFWARRHDGPKRSVDARATANAGREADADAALP